MCRRATSDAARMQALESYVRDQGGGLIFAAGETTYGQSGLSGSALEKVLPVEFKAQEKRKDLALVVCLDRSYSMKGRPMDLAKAATRAALGPAGGAAPLRRGRLRLAAARSGAAAVRAQQAQGRGPDRPHPGQRADQHLSGAGHRLAHAAEHRYQEQARDPAVRWRYRAGRLRTPAQAHDRCADHACPPSRSGAPATPS